MANMSYCMFENTATDLNQCLNAMLEWIDTGGTFDEFYESLGSESERAGFDSIMHRIDQVSEAFEHLKEA